MEADFSDRERTELLGDLAAWKQELHANDGLSDDEWDAFIAEIQTLDDEALLARWQDTVGEWILSRDDVYRRGGYAPGVDGEAVLEAELERLLDPDATTSYGFLGGRPAVPAA